MTLSEVEELIRQFKERAGVEISIFTEDGFDIAGENPNIGMTLLTIMSQVNPLVNDMFPGENVRDMSLLTEKSVVYIRKWKRFYIVVYGPKEKEKVIVKILNEILSEMFS